MINVKLPKEFVEIENIINKAFSQVTDLIEQKSRMPVIHSGAAFPPKETTSGVMQIFENADGVVKGIFKFKGHNYTITTTKET